jgi:uncharacterized protein
MSAASEQDPNLLTPSHPNEASPGRNDIVVATNRLEPGGIVPVEIEIWPSSTLFRKGEALQLTVQGGDFSYTKSNPLPVEHGRIPVSHARTVNRGRHTLHTGGRYDSHLLVPVIPQDN